VGSGQDFRGSGPENWIRVQLWLHEIVAVAGKNVNAGSIDMDVVRAYGKAVTDTLFSRHQSSHRAVGQTLQCRQPSFSGCRFLHLELTPCVHRQRIYSTVISTSSENFHGSTFISRHSSVVNIFTDPSSNDDYLGHSKIMID